MMLSLVLLISLFAGYESLLDEGHPQKVADSDLVKGRLDKTKIVPPLAKKSKLILYVEYDSTSTADKCQLDIDFEMSDPSKLSDNQLLKARFIKRPEKNYLTLVQSSKVDGKWKKWKGKGLKGMKSGKHQLQIYVGAEFFTVEIYGNGLQTEFPSKVSTDLISGFTAIKFSSKHPSCFRPIPDSIEILHEEAIEDCEGGQIWFTGISGLDRVNCKPGQCSGRAAFTCPNVIDIVCPKLEKKCRSGCACPEDKPVMIDGICSTMDACPIINGGWTDWPKDWSFCSKNCGGGEKTKTRTCTNPEPANGGSECVGKGTKKRSCNTDVCPDATQIAKERAEREKEDQEQADYYSSDEYYYKNNMTRRGEDEPRLQSEKLLL